MDNASFLERADILEAVKQTSCSFEFLPPYGPDLNPIERKWAQAKGIRKNADVMSTLCFVTIFLMLIYNSFAV